MSSVQRRYRDQHESYEYAATTKGAGNENIHKALKIAAVALLLIGAVFATIAILSGFGVAPWGMTAAFTGSPALAVALAAVGGMKMAATIYLFSSFLFIGLAALAIRFLIKDKKDQEDIQEIMQSKIPEDDENDSDGYTTDAEEISRHRDQGRGSNSPLTMVVGGIKMELSAGDQEHYDKSHSSVKSFRSRNRAKQRREGSQFRKTKPRKEGEPPAKKTNSKTSRKPKEFQDR